MSNNFKYRKNSDEIFLRSLFAGMTETLTNKVSYTQIESDTNKRIIRVPFYLRATGQEGFLHYYFSGKDYETCEEYVEGSFDVVPRGVLSLDSSGIVSNEITSPHSRGDIFEVDNSGRILQHSAYINGIPLKLNFTLEIRTSTMSELWKIYQSIIKELHFTKKFSFIYSGLIVPARVSFPDSMETDGKMFKFTYGEMEKPVQRIQLECESYLPVVDDDSKIFSGNRITKFEHSYITDEKIGIEESIDYEFYAKIGGRILYENGANPYPNNVTLLDSDGNIEGTCEINDGYYLFTKVSPKGGYRIIDSISEETLKKDIVVFPVENKHIDFEV